MVLVEDMVSRRHAKITVGNDQVFIQDLGSTNGTFVNGEKIKRSRLNEGDRVLIGTSIIKLIGVEGQAAVEPARMNFEDMSAGKRSNQVRTMSGSIAEVPLPDLLQLFAATKKTGVLVVRLEAEFGKIHLDQGRVVFAQINDEGLHPEKAFYRILLWENGTFELEAAEERTFPQQIDLSTEGLLMESMRQVDELRRLGPDMPAFSAMLAITSPLESPLRDLSPVELDVLQLVLNLSKTDRVLNRSVLSDLDASEVLVKLIRSGYVRVV